MYKRAANCKSECEQPRENEKVQEGWARVEGGVRCAPVLKNTSLEEYKS